jgi:hypothetical protein
MLMDLPGEFAAKRHSRTLGAVVIDELPSDPRITPEVRDQFRSASGQMQSLEFAPTALVYTPAPLESFAFLFWNDAKHTLGIVYLHPRLPPPPGIPPLAPRLSITFANNFTLPDGRERYVKTSNQPERPLWPDRGEINLSLPQVSSPVELVATHERLVRRHASGTPNRRRTAEEIPSFLQSRFDQTLSDWHTRKLIRFDPGDRDAYFYTARGARSLVWGRVGLIGDALDALHARRNRRLAASLR